MGGLTVTNTCRIFLYVLIMITSCIVFISMSISMYRTGGKCLLFSSRIGGTYFEYGKRSNCLFAVVCPIFFSFLSSVVFIVLGILNVCGKREILSTVTSRSFRLNLLSDLFCFVLMLSCAGLITNGLHKTCENLAGNMRNCEDSAINDHFDRKYYFFENLNLAMISCWFADLMWLVQLVLGLASAVFCAEVVTVQMKR